MNSGLISKRILIDTLEPFLEEHCSDYIKKMILAKIESMPEVEDAR